MQRKSLSLGHQHGGNRDFIVAGQCVSVIAGILTHGVHTDFHLRQTRESQLLVNVKGSVMLLTLPVYPLRLGMARSHDALSGRHYHY